VLLNEVPLVRVVQQVDSNTHTEELKILLDAVWGKPLSQLAKEATPVT